MNKTALKRDIGMLNAVLGFYLLKKAMPLVVNWEITTRCDQRCGYCKVWKNQADELGTTEILSVIDDLAAMGTQRVSLTGGEPLLREDLAEVVDYLVKKGIYVQINTNGILLKENISKVRKAEMINFSLDGTEQIHDMVRGKGTYQKVLGAIERASKEQTNIMLTVTLSKYNLDLSNAEYILSLAKSYNAGVIFQPSTLTLLGTEEKNNIASPEEDYRQLIDRLIMMKRAGNKYIFNSVAGLNYIRNWPQAKAIFCTAAKLICKIKANGEVGICNRYPSEDGVANCRNSGFKKAFHSLTPATCNLCWCARLVEFNYALGLNPEAVLNLLEWELKR